jgi:hypothetical protein
VVKYTVEQQIFMYNNYVEINHVKGEHYVRFEVFTAVTIKKAVFWDVAPCRNGVNRRFGGTYRLHLQGRKEIIRKSTREASVRDVRGRLLYRFLQ